MPKAKLKKTPELNPGPTFEEARAYCDALLDSIKRLDLLMAPGGGITREVKAAFEEVKANAAKITSPS